jgi:DNA-binding MarR family transcriptional regulator
VPRLDAARLGAWRELSTGLAEVSRRIHDDLIEQWDIPLAWFDVLAALQRSGGRARPSEVAAELRVPASSLSRRLDRLEEEGWIARHRSVSGEDQRLVDVELTRRGRNLWREMNVTYRRAVQTHFAGRLVDHEIALLTEVASRLGAQDELAT